MIRLTQYPQYPNVSEFTPKKYKSQNVLKLWGEKSNFFSFLETVQYQHYLQCKTLGFTMIPLNCL